MNLKKRITYREKGHNKRIKTSCGKYIKDSYYVIVDNNLLYKVYNKNTYIPFGLIRSWVNTEDIRLQNFIKDYKKYMKGKQ